MPSRLMLISCGIFGLGLKTTPVTWCVWAFITAPPRPVSRFHIRTVRSPPAVANHVSSGLNADA